MWGGGIGTLITLHKIKTYPGGVFVCDIFLCNNGLIDQGNICGREEQG
jgi:hypothetical protein